MNVAIIGCGLIGKRRAEHLSGANLLACMDVIPERSEALATKHEHCISYLNWQEAILHDNVDTVIIATHHAALPEIALFAAEHKKNILIEKPGAKRALQLNAVLAAVNKNKVKARVGFNLRYHRAFRKAYELVKAGELGELMFLRARYGHGGRLNYHQEWRADPELSGGGELLDQGVHLIDLARSFLGDFHDIQGFAHTYFWPMPVEDNGFLILKNRKNQIAHLHASCTEWKNTFSFELYGEKGKIEINGLGGSYGVERLSFYKMLPEMGPPETYIFEYPMSDNSFALEFSEFKNDIYKSRDPEVGIRDAQAALEIVEAVYRMSGR